MYKCNHCNITIPDNQADERIVKVGPKDNPKFYCVECGEPVTYIPDVSKTEGIFHGAQTTLISNSDNRITTNNYYGGMPEEQVETKFGTCKRSDARFCKHCQQWVPFTFFNEEKHICSDCEAEQIRNDYDDGLSYFNDGLYDDAVPCFLKYLKICPNEEQAKVKTLIGQCYYELKNYREARKYFVVASRENLDSLYYLGLCYFNGYDVPKNLKTAIDYFRGAAQKGHDKSREIIENIDLSAEKGENGLWGYKSADGSIVIDYQYHDAGKFSEGFARVMNSENKWGYIDKWGNIVLPYQWNFACAFFDGMAKVEDEHDQRFLINKEGTIIKEMCSSCKQWLPMSQFHQGLTICTDCEKKEVLASYDKGCQLLKKGLYSEALSAFQSYKSVCPQKRQKSLSGYMGQCYFGMKDYTQAFICLENADSDNAYSLYYQGLCYYKGLGTHRDCVKAMNFFRLSASMGHSKTEYFLEDLELTEEVDANGKWGYTNEDGEVVIPYRWKDADSFFEDLAFVQDFNDLYGFIDKTGQLVIPCQWKDTDAFSEGLAYVQDTSGKYGFIDKSGCVVIPCKWKDAHSFEKGLAKVQDDEDKWYYIDKKGKTVWEDVGPLKDGLARARDPQGKYGYIDKDRNVFIPCQWKMAYDFNEGLAAVMDSWDEYGYIDKTGKEVTPCRWKSAPLIFTNGLAHVMDNQEKWHIINKRGTDVWSNVGPLCEGLIRVRDSNGKFGYIDSNGEIVFPCEWVWAGDFYGGFAIVETEALGRHCIDKSGKILWEGVSFLSNGMYRVHDSQGMYGFLDERKTLVIPCQWKYAHTFSNGLAAVMDSTGKYGIIDKTGKVVIPCKYKEISADFHHSLARVLDFDNECSYINTSGDTVWTNVGPLSEGMRYVRNSEGLYGYMNDFDSIVISCQWNDAKDFENGLAAVMDSDKKWHYIDKSGTIVLHAMGSFSEGLQCVCNMDGKYGFIDQSQKIAIPCTLNDSGTFLYGMAIVNINGERVCIDKNGKIVWKKVGYLSEGFILVCDSSGKYGYISKERKLIIRCQWKKAVPFKEGMAAIQESSGKCGYIDKTGKVAIRCQWKRAVSFSEGLAMVEDYNDKFGFIDKAGKYITPCQWEEAYSFSGGLAPVLKKGNNWAFIKENDKWGYIDKNGKVAIPFKWKSAKPFSEDYADVQDFNDKWGCIDKRGIVVISCSYNNVNDLSKTKARFEETKARFRRLCTESKQQIGEKQLIDKNQQVAAQHTPRAQQLRTRTIKDKLPGPNDPCPCGSGKRFRNCHGKGIV